MLIWLALAWSCLVSVLASSSPTIIVSVLSTIAPDPVIQTLYTCDIGQSACALDMFCENSGDENPNITKVVVYNYVAPVFGMYDFTTANAATSCADTFMTLVHEESGAKYCNDDIRLVLEQRSRLNLTLQVGEEVRVYVGSVKDRCPPGETVSLQVSLRLTPAPTKLPTTLTPTLLPTTSPTNLPSRAPTTSRPSQSPTTSQPSQMPTTSQPSKMPTTSQPSRAPSFSPTFPVPTRSPTTSLPSATPTQSPTFICRAGTYSSTGFHTGLQPCLPCPAGSYDLPTSTFRTDCEGTIPCAANYLCGPGTVLNDNYFPFVSHTDIDSTLVVASRRELVVEFTKLVPGYALQIYAEQLPSGFSLVRALVDSPSTEMSFTVSLWVDADSLDEANLSGEGQNLYSGSLRLWGRQDAGPDSSFYADIVVNLQLVSVVINPSAFAYELVIGHSYSTALSPLPISEVLNPLCTDTLQYTSRICQAGLLEIAPNTLRVAELPPNESFGNKYEFAIDLRNVTAVADYTLRARTVQTCIAFNMTLLPTNITFSRTIDVSITLLQYCPPGTSSLSGMNDLGCTRCADRTYQPIAGSMRCFPVSPGFEVNPDRTGMTACVAGTYSAAQMDKCRACPKGTYSDEMESSVCKPCPSATFPTTLEEGATGVENCTTDRYQNAFKNHLGQLQTCPLGTSCDFDGATIGTLRVNPGYYRTSNASLNVLACKPKFCEPEQEHERRRLDTYFAEQDTEYCTPHHQGHLCEICEPGFVHRGDYRVCEFCVEDNAQSDRARMAGVFIGLSIALVLVCLLVLVRSYEHYKPKLGSATEEEAQAIAEAEAALRTSPPPWYSPRSIYRATERVIRLVDMLGGTPLKITIGFYQVVAGMAVALLEYLPDYFKTLADFFNLLSLDFTKLFDFGCSMPDQSHLSSLLFATLLPILFLLALFACELALRRRVQHAEALHIGFMNLYLWILFLVYPSMCKTIFQTFSCITFDDGMTFLKTDVQIDCSSELYGRLHAYAVFSIITLVFGIPAACYVLLDRQRFQLNACPEFEPRISLAYREKNMAVQGTRMLWSGYSPKRYNFEVFELCRKLFQTSVFVFVSNNTAAQVIFLLIICAIVVVLLGWLNPYVNEMHNGLAQWAQWNIFAIAFVALVNQMDLASEPDDAALDALLLLSLISVPVLAFVIAVQGNRTEVEKQLSNLAALARKTKEERGNLILAIKKQSLAVVKQSQQLPSAAPPKLRFSLSRRRVAENSNYAIAELETIITSLGEEEGMDQTMRDRMLRLVNELNSKYKEEHHVAKIERGLLLDDRNVQGQLKNKIAELEEENEEVKFSVSLLHERLSAIKEQRDKLLAEQKTPGNAKKKSSLLSRERMSSLAQDMFFLPRTRAASAADMVKRRMTGFLFRNQNAGERVEDANAGNATPTGVEFPIVFYTNRALADSNAESTHSRSVGNSMHEPGARSIGHSMHERGDT